MGLWSKTVRSATFACSLGARGSEGPTRWRTPFLRNNLIDRPPTGHLAALLPKANQPALHHRQAPDLASRGFPGSKTSSQ